MIFSAGGPPSDDMRFCGVSLCVCLEFRGITNGMLITLPDSVSDSYYDSDFKPSVYIVLCRIFYTTYNWIQIPVLTANYRTGN